MRRLLLLGVLLCPLGLLLMHCFQPALPDCAYRCGDPGAGPVCPEDYECREDHYCHRVGTVGECPFPKLDLMPGPDLVVAPDLPDMIGGDGGDAGGDGMMTD
jgi:hypothetical protein